MKPVLTAWFNGEQTVPGRPGVYERMQKHCTPQNVRIFSYWNGKAWMSGVIPANPYSPQHAIDRASRMNYTSAYQNSDWRGLTEEPR
jgi:hypothetical protein